MEDQALSDPGPTDPDVFLSYAHQDEARARDLASALERERMAVFWDREVPPGQTWDSYIGEALTGAKCVVVAWSSSAVKSRYVIEEAAEGRDRNVLVPVLFEAVQLPFGFRRIQAANLIDWRPGRPSPAFEGLLGAVRRIVGGQPGSGTQPAPRAELSPESTRPPPPSTSRRSYRPVAVMVAGLVAVAGAGSAAVYWWRTQPAEVSSAAGDRDQWPRPSHQRPSRGRRKSRSNLALWRSSLRGLRQVRPVSLATKCAIASHARLWSWCLPGSSAWARRRTRPAVTTMRGRSAR